MGVLVTRSPERAEALRTRRIRTGAMPGALECYLALRALRTLAVRMERAQAQRPASSPPAQRAPAGRRGCAIRVCRPTRSTSGRRAASAATERWSRSRSTGRPKTPRRCASAVELITHATSLGGVESLIERRARYETDAAHGTPPSLLRLSVGIEHVDDLWADLAGLWPR